MHWIALALLALLVGWLHTKISPVILAKAPSTGGAWTLTFFTGAVILLVVFIAAFGLSLVGLKPRGA